jgi:hypothetical protein
VAGAIALLVLSCGALVAGWGYVKTARRMGAFATTPGTVIARELATLTGGEREGRWGKGGSYRPQVTYTYEVEVHYDPAAPNEAYLETQTPTVGYLLVTGGGLGVLLALALLVA